MVLHKMNPLKEGYYGYKLVKALAAAGIIFAILLADCLTGFKRCNTLGRWIGIVLGSLAVASSIYYWRKFDRDRRGHHHGRTSRHLKEPEVIHRNPPAILPTRRDEM